jgi:hypothetical protein
MRRPKPSKRQLLREAMQELWEMAEATKDTPLLVPVHPKSLALYREWVRLGRPEPRSERATKRGVLRQRSRKPPQRPPRLRQ